jgi:hypothetical protein
MTDDKLLERGSPNAENAWRSLTNSPNTGAATPFDRRTVYLKRGILTIKIDCVYHFLTPQFVICYLLFAITVAVLATVT